MLEEECQSYSNPPVNKCSRYCNSTYWPTICDRMGLGMNYLFLQKDNNLIDYFLFLIPITVIMKNTKSLLRTNNVGRRMPDIF